jgi:hypothetical protein
MFGDAIRRLPHSSRQRLWDDFRNWVGLGLEAREKK